MHNNDGSGHEAFNIVVQPVYVNQNAYLNGAVPFDREENVVSDFNPEIIISEEGNEVYLEITLLDDFENLKGGVHSTQTLKRVRLTDMDFEKPDGSDVIINKDLLGQVKEGKTVSGPLSNLKSGKNKIKVWD